MQNVQSSLDSGVFTCMDFEAMTDESIRSMLPDLMTVLSHADNPAFPQVLACLKKRENLFFPFVSDILHSSDGNRKYWVMNQLIPSFTDEHKQALRRDLECICYAPSCSDEDMTLSDCAEDCLEVCFGRKA